MASLPIPSFTPQQYLELERRADHKSEYVSGQIFAMPRANVTHNTITLNIAAELGPQLRGKDARAFISAMRVLIEASDAFVYPDVIAIRGERHFVDAETDTLTNPTFIVEVLSPATELYDRGEKFALYRTLPSLTDYVLISQDKIRVEHYTRQDASHWLLSVATEAGEELVLASIGCSLTLAAIYENVAFAPTIAHTESPGAPFA